MPQKVTLKVDANLYKKIEQAPIEYKMLLDKARDACDNAYAPYSNFFVGAAILLENGEIIIGNNQENAAYPSGLCAERTAVYWVGANYPKECIKLIAVSAKLAGESQFLGVSPCGSCRQALLEYENKQSKSIKMILEHDEGMLVFDTIKDLLPLQFSDLNLKKN